MTLKISVLAAFMMPLLGQLLPASEMVSAPIYRISEFIEEPLAVSQTTNTIPISETLITEHTKPINWTNIIYWLAVSGFLLRFAISYQSIKNWLRNATITPYKGMFLAIVNEAIQAFSFSKYIVLSKQDYHENKTAILLHEEAHIRLHHTFDVVFIELICYLQWFNPFVWLLKKELKLIHEYQADQAVLNTGIDATQYQLLILERAVGKRRFATANHFKQGSISKRLKMMKKKQIKRWSIAKALLFLPMGFLLLQAFTQPKIIKTVNEFQPLISQIDSSQNWMSHWVVGNLAQSNQIVTKLASMAETGTLATRSRIKKRNVLQILQNKNSQYQINGQIVSKHDIQTIALRFIQAKSYLGCVAPEAKEMSFGGKNKAQISKGVIVYGFDKTTNKAAIDYTLKAIGKAHLLARKEKAKSFFNKAYFKLKGSERSFIDKIIPIRVMKLKSRETSELSMHLKITKDGLFFNNKACDLNQLAEIIRPIVKENPNAQLKMMVEPKLEMGIVDDVKKELTLAGVTKLIYSINEV